MNEPIYLYELAEQDEVFNQACERYSDNLLKQLKYLRKHELNKEGDNPIYLQQLLVQAEDIIGDYSGDIVIKNYELEDLLNAFICAVEHLPVEIVKQKPGICKFIQSHTEEFMKKVIQEVVEEK